MISLRVDASKNHSVFVDTLEVVKDLKCKMSNSDARVRDCRNNVGDYFVTYVSTQHSINSLSGQDEFLEKIILAPSSD